MPIPRLIPGILKQNFGMRGWELQILNLFLFILKFENFCSSLCFTLPDQARVSWMQTTCQKHWKLTWHRLPSSTLDRFLPHFGSSYLHFFHRIQLSQERICRLTITQKTSKNLSLNKDYYEWSRNTHNGLLSVWKWRDNENVVTDVLGTQA